MEYASGMIYQETKLIRGYIGFDEGEIVEVGYGTLPHRYRNKLIGKGTILPLFFNAHIHLADAVVDKVPLTASLQELVAPPDGLKHRVLRKTPARKQISVIKDTLAYMLRIGIFGYCAFYELGERGVKIALQTINNSPLESWLLGRPLELKYDRDEIDKVLKLADGIGISSISDWNCYEDVQKLAKYVHSQNKLFALHVSEAKREDIELVLDLNPDLIVHLSMAKETDFELVASNRIPVVICPRSNLYFGIIPDIVAMYNSKLTLALGTDNVMLNLPDMFRELEYAIRIMRLKSEIKSSTTTIKINAESLFELAIRRFQLNKGRLEVTTATLDEGSTADFFILDKLYPNIGYIIMRCEPLNIATVVIHGDKKLFHQSS